MAPLPASLPAPWRRRPGGPPVEDLPDGVRRETRVVHGHRRSLLVAGPPLGTAPVAVLVHGIGDSATTWLDVAPALARTCSVLAPDLLGHGASDKPRADYSLGGFANGVRDLLVLLGVERATIVGHSLGGGVAQQFAYQYPEFCERLVLVASGGLGAEVTPLLRAAAVPGASLVIAASARAPVRVPVLTVGRLAARLGLLDSADVDEVATVWSSLGDRSTRAAFLRTLRSVVDLRGQAVTSRDRLYLAAALPTLLVWGARDPIIPVAHARAVSDCLPDARIEVLRRAGHLPHRHDSLAFAELVTGFITGTTPAHHDPMAWRDMLLAGDAEPASTPAAVQDEEPVPA
jgi:pimeloyl-ACP methyl ester carboxylesterase